ncbi:MAG: glycine--tRNA ligase subunit beta [Armatimonadota bacterium]|nr:glycine--tRNA ligase subunit beta [Armatimonadota bacterium]
MPEPATGARFLLEIGCEELPPGALASVLEQLAAGAAEALRKARLDAAEPRATGTLRRLVLTVADVKPRQADRVTVVRGPAARIAYDGAGHPTQAAAGFARSVGVPVEALQVREVDGGRYVVAEVREAGRPATEVLGAVLPAVVAGLAFPKTMRWKAGGIRFGRPIRWVVALLGRRVVRMEIAGVRAGRRTYGHRFLAPGAIVLREAGDYHEAMRRAGVILDYEERRRRIVDGAHALAAEVGGRPVIDEALLEELAWSVEHPTPLLGTFDQALARGLPKEVVLVTLQHHQKSFGVQDAEGQLLPAFIAVRDGGTSHLASVRTGHEWVVRARLEDARFFLEEDRRGSFDGWNAQLARLAHVEGLGSMADHVRRVQRVAAHLAEAALASEADRRTLERAAALCKADLVTALVREFPELQGIVGRIYALESGEPHGVAAAIEEHYWPRSAGGPLPQTTPGALLGVADRSVLLAGAALAGLEPTGSQDPYGLRRAASGMVAILAAHGLHLSLAGIFDVAAEVYEAAPDARARAATSCVSLALQRLRMALQDQGMAYDTVDAVLAAGGDDVADLVARARALQAVRTDPAMPRLSTGFARASRILKQGHPAATIDEGLLEQGSECGLYQAWKQVRADVERLLAGRGEMRRGTAPEPVERYARALEALERLADPIDRFFDDVLVMAPDPAVRANRLALLREVTATFLEVADFSRLSG